MVVESSIQLFLSFFFENVEIVSFFKEIIFGFFSNFYSALKTDILLHPARREEIG